MLPQLYNTKKTKNVIRVFKGINRTVNAGFSSVSSNSSNMYVEFENVKNMPTVFQMQRQKQTLAWHALKEKVLIYLFTTI